MMTIEINEPSIRPKKGEWIFVHSEAGGQWFVVKDTLFNGVILRRRRWYDVISHWVVRILKGKW